MLQDLLNKLESLLQSVNQDSQSKSSEDEHMAL